MPTEGCLRSRCAIFYKFIHSSDSFDYHGDSRGSTQVNFQKASSNIICDTSCLTCSGTASNQCITCPSGKTLSLGSCISVVAGCHTSCKMCSSSLQNGCISCQAGLYLVNGYCKNDVALPSSYSNMASADFKIYWDFQGDMVTIALQSNK